MYVLADILADLGDDGANVYIEPLRAIEPVEADAILARLRWRQGRLTEASAALEAAFVRYQHDPWPLQRIMARALDVAVEVAAANNTLALRLYEAVRQPFAIRALDFKCVDTVLRLAAYLDFETYCAAAFAPLEPNVPWQRELLIARYRCYRATRHPLAVRAAQELNEFMADEPVPFAWGLDEGSGF